MYWGGKCTLSGFSWLLRKATLIAINSTDTAGKSQAPLPSPRPLFLIAKGSYQHNFKSFGRHACLHDGGQLDKNGPWSTDLCASKQKETCFSTVVQKHTLGFNRKQSKLLDKQVLKNNSPLSYFLQ